DRTLYKVLKTASATKREYRIKSCLFKVITTEKNNATNREHRIKSAYLKSSPFPQRNPTE
ncbi:hypothetical protein QP572_13120, partial [Brevibacterium sp. UMB10442]|nr:hypothetical protein [Brevibacterium sp. UMB10442]